MVMSSVYLVVAESAMSVVAERSPFVSSSVTRVARRSRRFAGAISHVLMHVARSADPA
jgi:hypothetical protein